MTDCLIDGLPLDVVPADDRGLLYGDHLFETIAFHGTRAPLWDRHWQRFVRGCAMVGLEVPNEALVHNECVSLCRPGGSTVIRLTLTRGSGGRAYWPPAAPDCRRIVQRRAWPDNLAEQQESGLNLVISPVRVASGSPLAGLKHGNRLEQVLVARACAGAGADEALVLNHRGRLVEAVSSNVLLEIGDGVFTPRTGAGVDGVGLAWLADQPEVRIVQADLGLGEIRAADGIMVINSVAGIRPARMLDGQKMAPTPRCRLWQKLWNNRLSGSCAS